jgi:hypothetical protein
MLWVVHEVFCLEETLFVGGKDEVLSADDTLKHPILEFHLRLSDRRRSRMPHATS